MMEVQLQVNGSDLTVTAEPTETLLSVLRNRLRLTGTKEGCSEGECGSCTVLLDGMPIDSCLFPVAAAAGREVETVESLWASEVGQRLQRSFVDGGGVQCGFCTPGFLITLTALLRDHPSPSEGEVREAVVGNICRCTGYSQIVDAAVAASRKGQG